MVLMVVLLSKSHIIFYLFKINIINILKFTKPLKNEWFSISSKPYAPNLFIGSGFKNNLIKSTASGLKQSSLYPMGIYSHGILIFLILSNIFSMLLSLNGVQPTSISNNITPTLHQLKKENKNKKIKILNSNAGFFKLPPLNTSIAI